MRHVKPGCAADGIIGLQLRAPLSHLSGDAAHEYIVSRYVSPGGNGPRHRNAALAPGALSSTRGEIRLIPLPTKDLGMNSILKVAVLAWLLPTTAVLAAQQDYFSNWPAGRSPQQIGKALAEHFIVTPHTPNHTIVY